MANNCYNTFSFFGNSKVNKQIEEWLIKLKEGSLNKSDTNKGFTIFEVFFPGEDIQSAIPYLGTKWAYPDFGESISLDADELGFVSAWNSMEGFQDHLTVVLNKLDKNVVVLLSSNTETYEEEARYTAIDSDGSVISESAQLNYADADGGKEEPDYPLFYEHRIDSCEDLITLVPGIKTRLKSHLKYLNKAFEESLKG
jgi:hypothetical protein